MQTVAEYEAWKADQQKRQAAQSAFIIGAVHDQNPDQLAGDLNLASEFGRVTGKPTPPAAMAGEYRSVFQSAIDKTRAETILSSSPRLTDWLRNPENATLAKDDLEGLSQWERIGAALKQGDAQTVVNSRAFFGAMASWLERSGLGRGMTAAQNYIQGTDVTPEQKATEALAQITDPNEPILADAKATVAKYEAQGFAPKTFGQIDSIGSALGWLSENAAASLPQMALMLTGPGGVAASYGANSGDVLQELAAKTNLTPDQQLTVASSAGAVITLLDAAGLGEVTAPIGVRRMAVEAAKGTLGDLLVRNGYARGFASAVEAAVVEGSTEAMQEAIQVGSVYASGGRYAPGEIQSRIGNAFAAGVGVGGVFGGAASFREGKRDAARARSAENRKTLFTELSGQATNSKLRARMPDRFRDFVAKATEGGPVENVFVPAEQFQQYFQSVGIDPMALADELDGVTRDDLEAALAAGGDLRIPTATYASRIAGSEHDAFLMDNMRFDPLDMTATEAADFNARVDDIMQEMWAQAEDIRQEDERWRAVEEKIHDQVVSELRMAGLSTERAMAEVQPIVAFYRTRAARLGLATEEYLARHPLPKVEGSIPQGMQFKNVDELNRTLAEARSRRAPVADTRQSLLEFIDARGGIIDNGGELKARDAEVVKRGRGRKNLVLARDPSVNVSSASAEKGRAFGVDDVAQAAIEAGFMADNPTVIAYKTALAEGTQAPDITPALWDAIDAELRGAKQVSEQDHGQADTAHLDEIEAYLNSLGMDLSNTDEEIRAAIEQDQAAPDRMYAQDGEGGSGVIPHGAVASWQRGLSRVWDGVAKTMDNITMGRPGAVLRALGMSRSPITFSVGKLKKVMKDHPEITKAVVERLAAGVNDPAFVLQSSTDDASLVIVPVQLDDGRVLVVPIRKDVEDDQGRKSNLITSAYIKDDPNWLSNEIQSGRVIYARNGLSAGERANLSGSNSQRVQPNPAGRIPPRSSKVMTLADVVKSSGRMLFQSVAGPRGLIQFGSDGQSMIRLFETANLSTLQHELGHFFLTMIQHDAATGDAGSVAELETVKTWWRENAAAVAADGNKAMPEAKITAEDVHRAIDTGSTGDMMKDAAVDVGMQEQWARGYEAYLMEGKAPSEDLQGVFAKMRAWMISVYKAMRGLNVNITPEIRAVFDRMLATDEEIAKAQRASGSASPVFATAEQMGLTQDQFDRLMKLRTQAEDEAKARLQREIMEPIRRQKEQWFKEEKAKAEEEVTRQVNALPVFLALEWLGNRRWLGDGQPEAMPDMRMSKAILVERYGEGVLKTLPRGMQAVYAVEGGMDPDDIAGWFGFESGDHMIKAMERAPKRVDAIKAETDRLMNERHGDALNDGEVEKIALDAVHGDRRGEWIAAELKAVADVAGVDVKLTMKDARASARQTIARMKVRDAVAANRYLAAERKASSEAARLGAMLSREGVWMQNARRRIAVKAKAALRDAGTVDAVAGQVDQANASTGNYNDTVKRLIDAKRRQLLNHALFMEARAAADEVASAERFVQKLNKASMREKIAGAGRRENAQVDYLAAIDDILDGYDFRKLSGRQEQRRGALLAFVDAMKAAGRENELAIPEAVLSDANRKPYRALTVEELRGVVDSLKNLQHMATRWNDLIDAQNQRKLDEAVAEVSEAIEANLPNRPPSRVKTKGEAFRHGARQFLDLVLNATTLLREIDGFKDMGAAYRNLKAPIDQAMDRLTIRKERAAADMDALYSVYSKADRRRMAVREYIPALGYSLSKWEKIAIALNAGNEGNYQRLTDQRVRGSLTEAQVTAVLATLDARDADFVQSVWDYVGSFRDDIGAREKRATGVEPKWVEATPVEVGGKMLMGGYYPLKYDPRLSSLSRDDDFADALAGMQAGRFGKAQTKRGHLEARAKSSGRAVELDMSVLHRHVAQVIYDLELSEAVSNSWKVLKSEPVRSAFMDAGRQADFDALEQWMLDVGTGQLAAGDFINSASRRAKSNFTAAKLAFNLATVVSQVAGVSQTMVVVGKKDFLIGLQASFRKGVADEIAAKSPFMSERRTTFNKDIADFYNDPALGPTASRWGDIKREWVGPASFWLMTKVQWLLVDIPTWMAGYHQGLRMDGNDEAKAIAHADGVVKRAQGSGLFADRSAIERGSVSQAARQSDVVRLYTTLGSYMFAKFNVAYERAVKGGKVIRQEGVSLRSAQEAASLALDMAFLFTLEAVVLAAIKARLPGDDDEDGWVLDDWAKFLASETAFSVLGTMPIVRDAASAIQGFDGGGAYGGIISEIAKPFTEIANGHVGKGLLKSIISNTGLFVGIPGTTQINRAVDAIAGYSSGDMPPLVALKVSTVGK